MASGTMPCAVRACNMPTCAAPRAPPPANTNAVRARLRASRRRRRERTQRGQSAPSPLATKTPPGRKPPLSSGVRRNPSVVTGERPSPDRPRRSRCRRGRGAVPARLGRPGRRGRGPRPSARRGRRPRPWPARTRRTRRRRRRSCGTARHRVAAHSVHAHHARTRIEVGVTPPWHGDIVTAVICDDDSPAGARTGTSSGDGASGARLQAVVPTPVGAVLLARLRGEGSERPSVDPGLAGGLRDWLVDALFRQWMATGRIEHPLSDALAALVAGGDGADVEGFVAALPVSDRRALADEVALHAEHVMSSWPRLPPGFMARTQERLLLPIAGGRIVLSGVLDLALGAPSTGRASVCIVEVKSGRRRVEHRGDLHLYALMETLRSGAPPFRVATYYTA